MGSSPNHPVTQSPNHPDTQQPMTQTPETQPKTAEAQLAEALVLREAWGDLVGQLWCGWCGWEACRAYGLLFMLCGLPHSQRKIENLPFHFTLLNAFQHDQEIINNLSC